MSCCPNTSTSCLVASDVVVDTSLVFKWIFNEDDVLLARTQLRSWLNTGTRIVVPCWFACELGNVLHQQVLKGNMTDVQAMQRIRIPFLWITALDPDPEIAVRGIQIASQLRQRASYDAQYLALAERLGCELGTADRRCALATQPDFPFVHWLGQGA